MVAINTEDTKDETVALETVEDGHGHAADNRYDAPATDLAERDGEGDRVTLKTWFVITMLSLSYGFGYFPVTSLSTTQGYVATVLGQPPKAVWFISVFNIAITSSYMICGVNSDLFGRRWFIVIGNLVVVIGTVVAGSAKSANAVIIGMAITGFGSANCALAVFAIPELLPNKWRHIGVTIADTSIAFVVLCGPSLSRYAMTGTTAWRWLFYSNSIANGFAGIVIFFWYHPPKHPRGIPWKQAVLELDYVGGLLFVLSLTGILSGISYASYLPSTNPHVLGLLITGFGVLVLFALWERYAPLKQPLTPTRLFTHNRGRTLSFPLLLSTLVTIYYLAINIIWGTMVSLFYARSTADAVRLSLVQGFGFLTGAIGCGALGSTLKHWRLAMFISTFTATLFGGLLALANPNSRAMSITFTFINSVGYGWAQILVITFCQFGAEQSELGIAGGLAGVSRYAGGAISGTVFVTILSNAVASNLHRVTQAAIAAGASQETAEGILAAIPLGAQALAEVPGATTAMIQAAGAAFLKSYELGLRTTALASIAFGGVACVVCFGLEDINPKMNQKIEVFLENDVNAEKNRFH